jgi:hypothetical protein
MAGKLLAAVVVAVALGGVAPATGDQLPILRSAAILDHRVVLEVSVSDLRPVQLTIATRRAVDADGALLRKNVRLREAIQLAPLATGVVRWQSRTRLVPGVYFVQVTAVDTGGVTDCPKFLRNCLDHWSNVRRVTVSTSA